MSNLWIQTEKDINIHLIFESPSADKEKIAYLILCNNITSHTRCMYKMYIFGSVTNNKH
jgi:hypothetical protein